MKKLVLIALVLLIAVSVAACSSGMTDETTAPTGNTTTTPSTAAPSTQPTVTMPTIIPDPTLGTNIPDPSVNENSTMPNATGSGIAERIMPGRK